jgi:hypothetical protein
VRSFKYADFLRVVSTYSEVQKVSLLAEMPDILMSMTLEARDFPGFDSNYLEISHLFLLAGVGVVIMGGINESGNILLAVPCTAMFQKYLCLQEY